MPGDFSVSKPLLLLFKIVFFVIIKKDWEVSSVLIKCMNKETLNFCTGIFSHFETVSVAVACILSLSLSNSEKVLPGVGSHLSKFSI